LVFLVSNLLIVPNNLLIVPKNKKKYFTAMQYNRKNQR
jgi:hypothetical protein